MPIPNPASVRAELGSACHARRQWCRAPLTASLDGFHDGVTLTALARKMRALHQITSTQPPDLFFRYFKGCQYRLSHRRFLLAGSRLCLRSEGGWIQRRTSVAAPFGGRPHSLSAQLGLRSSRVRSQDV